MLEAPVGLALFGPDMRFRWVNAALKRLGGQPGVDGSDLSGPAHRDPSGWAGLLPSQAWPESIATRAENALRQVLAEGVPLAEGGYPAVGVPVADRPRMRAQIERPYTAGLDKAGTDQAARQAGPDAAQSGARRPPAAPPGSRCTMRPGRSSASG